MEEEIEIGYESIKESEEIKKSFPKKCCSFMSNFNKEKDLSDYNSNIKHNQISVIEKYGVLYFFNEEGIYFLDNSKMKELINDYKDLSYSELFHLKCKNIFKIFTVEEDGKTYLIICTKKVQDNIDSNNILIYIDIDNLIVKINHQKIIYDKNLLAPIEKKEDYFHKGLALRELDELDRNIELNENGEYDENLESDLNPKKKTLEEKINNFLKEKKKKLDERDEIFRKSYKKAVNYKPFKIRYIEDIIKDVIILDLNQYIILYENGNIIFYNNYEKIRILQKDAQLMSYNKDTSIFLIISHDYIYILKEKNNFESLEEIKEFPRKDILSDEEKYNLIYCENKYNYIVLYTIDNNNAPEEYKEDDILYFVELNENMEEIIKIYREEHFFTPDDYELKGISQYSQLKRTIFTLYDKDLGVYMIFNKHMNKLDKYYYFEKNKDNTKIYDLYSIQVRDEYYINSYISKSQDENEEKNKYDELNEEEQDKYMEDIKENNAIIGVSLIRFKFDGYDQDTDMVEKEIINAPYLIVVLGFYGGFRVFYASCPKKLIEKNAELFSEFKNISNKVLEISLNEEMIEIEKEKYLNENKKKEKGFIELKKLKKLNQRNLFLHELDQQIKENLEHFDNLAIPEKLNSKLKELRIIEENKAIQDIQKSIDNLKKEAKDLFKREEENQKFIDDNKNVIKDLKNKVTNIKNEIKIIEDNKKTDESKLNINAPINELLTYPKIKNFFTEEKVTQMIEIFNKIKKNYNLYENHVNLINALFVINDNLIKQIEECKNKYNSIKDVCKFSKNRKDINEILAKLQNQIFLLYMKVFEQFFFNLEQFENNYLNKEYLYLTQLKKNKEEEEKEEEKKQEKLLRSHARFDLRDEEDIDEGNDISSNELEDNIISTSFHKKNRINSINNNIGNDEEQKLVAYNNKMNDTNISINNNYDIVNKDANDTIKKIFGTNLVKEKEASKKNYLIDVLSNFEGRTTYYNKETEEDYCTDAEELFQEFLIDEEEIKKKELKEKRIKEINEKKKKDILQQLEERIKQQNEEKEKIKKELSLISDKNIREINEKEKENEILRKKFEELEKKFEVNKKERENERKRLMEEDQKKKDDEQQKLVDEQNNANSKIKSLEDEIKNYQEKLKEEEKKRIEAEEKNKKLEEEKKNNINNNNILPNNILPNIDNLNIALNDNNEQNKKKEEDKDANKNKVSLFQSNIPNNNQSNIDNAAPQNIFLQPQKKDDNPANKQEKKPSIFESQFEIKNETKSTTSNVQNNIFTSTSRGNPQNVYQANVQKKENIFGFTSINNNQLAQPQNNLFNNIQTDSNMPQNTQTQPQNAPSNFLSQLTLSNQNSFFNNQNKPQTNLDINKPPSFGEHTGFGYQQNNNTNVNRVGTLSFNTTGNTNSASPFLSFGTSNNLFNNNQAQNNNNSNNNNEFF